MSSNDFLTNQLVARMALEQLENSNSLLMHASTEYQGDFDTNMRYEQGDSIRLPKQNFFNVTDGRIATEQAILEDSETLTVNHQYHVMIGITSKEAALEIDKNAEGFSDRFVRPAVLEIAKQAETDMAQDAFTQIAYRAGTPGSAINSFGAVNAVRTLMLKHAMPIYDTRPTLHMSPDDAEDVENALVNFFNKKFNQEIGIDSQLGEIAGFDMFNNQSIVTHTAGNGSGSPVIDGAVTSGNTIAISGLTASTGTILAGDVITINGVNSVNPRGRQDTGRLKQFVVTSGGTADGAGDLTITVSPSIISDISNPRRNVTAALPNGNAVNLLGAGQTYRGNIALTRRGLSCVMPRLPQKGNGATEFDPDTRISCRVATDYDIRNDVEAVRLDLLIGWKFHLDYTAMLVA